jgi:hypothetical protein
LARAKTAEYAFDRFDHRAFEIEHPPHLRRAADRFPQQQILRAAFPQIGIGAAEQVIGIVLAHNEIQDSVNAPLRILGEECAPCVTHGTGGIDPEHEFAAEGQPLSLPAKCQPDDLEQAFKS